MSLLYRNWLGRDARLEALLKLYGLNGNYNISKGEA